MSKKNSTQQVDVCIYRDGVTSSPTSSWTFQHLKMDHYTVSKCWIPITVWCGVTSHKYNQLSYTTAKTKKLTLLYFEEPIMSPYAPGVPQPHFIFMIHFITTLLSMSGTLKVDSLLWLQFVIHFSRLSRVQHALLIILLMLGKRQTLWSSKQEPFSKIIKGHHWKTLNTGSCIVIYLTTLSQLHR